MVDHGLSAQETVETPRWFSFPGTDPANLALPAVVRLEERVPEATRQGLAERGHVVETLGRLVGRRRGPADPRRPRTGRPARRQRPAPGRRRARPLDPPARAIPSGTQPMVVRRRTPCA